MKLKTISICVLLFAGCNGPAKQSVGKAEAQNSFIKDVNFLKKHTAILVLGDSTGSGRVAVSPALQGRVMTSSADGNEGTSFGWINNELFDSGDTSAHFNAFGGEERIWLGPEGGQFSIFFEKGKPFNLDNWYTPKFMDVEPFDVVSQSENNVRLSKTAKLKNYSGHSFAIKIDREIALLAKNEACEYLGIDVDNALKMVAFRTTNALQNIDTSAWSKSTGILSIWLLGMFKPTPYTTIVIPFNKGTVDEMGPIVNDTYFGKVPVERLKVADGVLFFEGDGQYRSKIGLSPKRATDVLGSYDEESRTLTIVKYNKPQTTDYVNSAWEIQEKPFGGDVVNSYNDGPPSPGAKPMGPFYELETSSPALELKQNESVNHIQTTYHFQGDEKNLDKVSVHVLRVKLSQIKEAFTDASKKN